MEEETGLDARLEELPVTEKGEEGLPDHKLQVIQTVREARDFMDGKGVLIFDTSGEHVMMPGQAAIFIARGNMIMTTKRVVMEMGEAEGQDPYNFLLKSLGKKGWVLESRPDECRWELGEYRKLTKGLAKYQVRQLFLENRYPFYRMFHRALQEVMKKYYTYSSPSAGGRPEKQASMDHIIKMATYPRWWERADESELAIKDCMDENRNECYWLVEKFKDKMWDLRRSYPGKVEKVLLEMGADEDDAAGFARRNSRRWDGLIMTCMRKMLDQYLEEIYYSLVRDGSIGFDGVTTDYGDSFWKKRTNDGITREKDMRRCIGSACHYFCRDFETDIELVMLGRRAALATDHPVALCSTDMDIYQLNEMRNALPY